LADALGDKWQRAKMKALLHEEDWDFLRNEAGIFNGLMSERISGGATSWSFIVSLAGLTIWAGMMIRKLGIHRLSNTSPTIRPGNGEAS